MCGANTPVRKKPGGDIAYEKASGHGQEVHPLGLVAYVWEDGRASARGEGRGGVVFSEPGVFEWNKDFPSQKALKSTVMPHTRNPERLSHLPKITQYQVLVARSYLSEVSFTCPQS